MRFGCVECAASGRCHVRRVRRSGCHGSRGPRLRPPRRPRRKRHPAGGGYSPPYAAMVVDVKSGTRPARGERGRAAPSRLDHQGDDPLPALRAARARPARPRQSLRVSANAAAPAARPSSASRPATRSRSRTPSRRIVTKSANDVAVVIAENLGGCEEDFAEMMTRKAQPARHDAHRLPQRLGPAGPANRSPRRATSPSSARAIQERFPRYYRYFQTRVLPLRGPHRSATTTGCSAGSRASTASRPATPAPPAST